MTVETFLTLVMLIPMAIVVAVAVQSIGFTKPEWFYNPFSWSVFYENGTKLYFVRKLTLKGYVYATVEGIPSLQVTAVSKTKTYFKSSYDAVNCKNVITNKVERVW